MLLLSELIPLDGTPFGTVGRIFLTENFTHMKICHSKIRINIVVDLCGSLIDKNMSEKYRNSSFGLTNQLHIYW